jgi:hypothetical protein
MMSDGKENAAQAILHKLRIPWPDADEHKLREAANAWRRLASNLESTASMANREATSLTSANYGPAVRAFEKQWSLYGDKGTGLLPLGVEACNIMAKGCDEFASKVEQSKKKIELAAIEVGATLVIGTVGAVLTFGASEAAAAGITATLSATVLGEIGLLGASAAEIAGLLAASALYGAFNAALSESAINAVKAILGDKLPSSSEELNTLLKGTLSGTVSGALGKGAGLTTAQLEKAFNEAATVTASSDPLLSQSLAQISRTLAGSGGKIVQGVSVSAATQLIVNQEISGKGLAASGLNKSITEALGKVQGK